MANEKRIKSVRRKLFSALAKAGMKVSQGDDGPLHIKLCGVEVFLSVAAVGTFAPEGATLKMTFGPYHTRRLLSLRETKKGFNYENIVARLKTVVSEERARLAAVAEHQSIRDKNTELAAQVNRKITGASKFGIRVGASSYRHKNKVNVTFDVDVYPDLATRVVTAIKREMASFE